MDSQSPFKKAYDAVLADKAKNPEASYSALIKKYKASYQGFWIYKRKLDGAKAATRPKVAPKTAPRGPQPVYKPADSEYIYIPVKRTEVVDAVLHDKHQIPVPVDRVFQTLPDNEVQELDALIGRVRREAAMKKAQPEEVGLSAGGGKKGGMLNKGG